MVLGLGQQILKGDAGVFDLENYCRNPSRAGEKWIRAHHATRITLLQFSSKHLDFSIHLLCEFERCQLCGSQPHTFSSLFSLGLFWNEYYMYYTQLMKLNVYLFFSFASFFFKKNILTFKKRMFNHLWMLIYGWVLVKPFLTLFYGPIFTTNWNILFNEYFFLRQLLITADSVLAYFCI